MEVWAAPVWQEKEKANWAPAFGYYCFLFAHSVWATSPLLHPHAFLAMIDCPLMPTVKKTSSFKKAFIILWEPYTTYFDHIPSPPLTPSTMLSKVAFISKVTGTKDKMTRRELCIRGSGTRGMLDPSFLIYTQKTTIHVRKYWKRVVEGNACSEVELRLQDLGGWGLLPRETALSSWATAALPGECRGWWSRPCR